MGQNRGRGDAILTLNELVLPFGWWFGALACLSLVSHLCNLTRISADCAEVATLICNLLEIPAHLTASTAVLS